MPPTPCPPPADLAGFHRGELPATAADTVAAHVEHCPACEAALQALDAGDGSLAAAFRRPADGRTGAWADGPPPLLDGVGTVVGGRYKLVEPVGEGGMGSVWMAQQTEPVRRLVAVKLIKAGMDSRQVLARFEAERQALALMDHPNIARVLDAGATTLGRPYFVMELVKGVPITDYCDAHKLTPRERLALFVPVCQAVQHAHQKGVIHRDIKPSNVLVARYDGRPVPKVIDFGVAKAAGQPLTDKTLVTGLGAVVGTPEYMAPEQAELNQLDVDTRADVYALGVVLYELLTGSTPLTRARLGKAALLEVLRLVREEEPPAPSTRLSTADALPSIAASRGTEPRRLTALMRGELDWVVMKALEKGPRPAVRLGRRVRPGRGAVPGRRAGGGRPADGRVIGCGSSPGGTAAPCSWPPLPCCCWSERPPSAGGRRWWRGTPRRGRWPRPRTPLPRGTRSRRRSGRCSGSRRRWPPHWSPPGTS